MKSSVLNKFGWNSTQTKKGHPGNDAEQNAKWLHHGKEIKDSFIAFNAKFLGSVEVSQPKGVEMVKDSIKKLKIARQLKKSEAGHKGSKLLKVEIIISIDSIKVVEVKNKNMICARPLQRVSYCADDHKDKRLFAFIAKEQESKTHKCFVFVSEKEASEITLTLGQAFQLAYKRYLEKEKTEIKQNKESINIGKEISKLKEENVRLRQELDLSKTSPREDSSSNTSSSVRGGNPLELPAMSSQPGTPIKSTLTTENFDFLSGVGFSTSPNSSSNDLSFDFSPDPKTLNNAFDLFNKSRIAQHDGINMNNIQLSNNYNNFDSFTTETNNNKGTDLVGIDMFGTFDGSPRDEDFFVRHDPFADTPDWSSVASEETNTQQVMQNQLLNGNLTNNIVKEPSDNNPFATMTGQIDNKLNHHMTGQYDDPPDLFSQYLTNVVATRTSSDASLNNTSSKNNLFYPEGSKSNSLDANLNLFNGSSSNDVNFNQFNTNNDIGFNKLNLTDASGNIMNEFNETDDGFFPDTNFAPRPKAHTITVLTNTQNIPNFGPFNDASNDHSFNKSNFTDSGNALNEIDESAVSIFPEDDFVPRPKADSGGFNASDQIVRPRPSSFSVPNQILPAPPSKQSLKKPTCIKTPTLKVLSSSPIKDITRKTSAEDKTTSPSYILPNVGRAQNAYSETRPRSRTKGTPLQSEKPLKESIFRASQSLEDLCGIGTNKSSSVKATNPFSTEPFPVQKK